MLHFRSKKASDTPWLDQALRRERKRDALLRELEKALCALAGAVLASLVSYFM